MKKEFVKCNTIEKEIKEIEDKTAINNALIVFPSITAFGISFILSVYNSEAGHIYQFPGYLTLISIIAVIACIIGVFINSDKEEKAIENALAASAPLYFVDVGRLKVTKVKAVSRIFVGNANLLVRDVSNSDKYWHVNTNGDDIFEDEESAKNFVSEIKEHEDNLQIQVLGKSIPYSDRYLEFRNEWICNKIFSSSKYVIESADEMRKLLVYIYNNFESHPNDSQLVDFFQNTVI